MNRLLKSFFGLTLGVAFSLGVAASINANKNDVTNTAEAANWASSGKVYIRIFKKWVNTDSSVVYLRYNSSDGWKNYTPTPITLVGGDDGSFYYYSHSFKNAPTTDIYIKRYSSKPGDSSDAAWTTVAMSKTYTSNLFAIDYDDNWSYGYYNGTDICNYHFQTPSNGTVTVSVTNSSGTSKGTATQGNADNYIYKDWKVSLSASANTGYGFSHWTESTNGGSTYVAWSNSDLRDNPKTNMTNMTGDVYHGVFFKQYKTIYYVSGEDYTTTNRIYAWTNYATKSGSATVVEFGSYDECWSIISAGGTEIFSDGVVKFRGFTNKIYKISLFSDNFLLRNSEGNMQTADFAVSEGSGYYWDGENADAGAAIALIEAEETARNSVTASGTIKQYSICGIAKGTAQSLVNTYNSGISATARGYINESTAYTYKGDGTNEKGNISFTAIFNQLSKIATGGSKSPLLSLSFMGNDNGMIIVVVITSLGILSVGAYFFFKKSKKVEE